MNQQAAFVFRFLALSAVLFGLGSNGRIFAQEVAKQAGDGAPAKVGSSTPAEDEDRAALNDKLAKYLTQTRWEGQFTMTGKEGNTNPEYYEIISAEKAELGDYWNLVARIKYGDKDATLPLPPIEIKFAGGTPVITVDQAMFPGFGTFDARVVIRQGKYAGTWSHGDVGGHLFGTIKKIEAGSQTPEKEDSEGAGESEKTDR